MLPHAVRQNIGRDASTQPSEFEAFLCFYTQAQKNWNRHDEETFSSGSNFPSESSGSEIRCWNSISDRRSISRQSQSASRATNTLKLFVSRSSSEAKGCQYCESIKRSSARSIVANRSVFDFPRSAILQKALETRAW